MSTATLPARPDTNGAPAAPARKRDFLTLLEATETKAEIQRLVADPKQADKIIRTVRTAWQLDPNLQQCTPGSILTACMKACELNLIPGNTRKHAWLIPYNTKQKDGSWAKECTFQIGYLGVLELARRSREFKVIEAVVVYKEDVFRYFRDPAPHIEHLPALTDNAGPIVAFYAYAKLQSDDYVVEVMQRAIVDKIRASSKQPDGPAWKNWYDQMGCRSVLNRLLKRQASSTEVSEAVAHVESAEFDSDRQTITMSPGSTRTQALTETLRNRRAPESIDPPSEAEYESQEQPEPEAAPTAKEHSKAKPDTKADVPVPDDVPGEAPEADGWKSVITGLTDGDPIRGDALVEAIVRQHYSSAAAQLARFTDQNDVMQFNLADAEIERMWLKDADRFTTTAKRVAGKLKSS